MRAVGRMGFLARPVLSISLVSRRFNSLDGLGRPSYVKTYTAAPLKRASIGSPALSRKGRPKESRTSAEVSTPRAW